MTEAELQAAVVDAARLFGWHCLHVRRSVAKNHRWATTTSVVGWPDLFLWRPSRAIAAELKSETGKLTAEQTEVLESLAAAGIECFVWRPNDFPESIVHTLRRVTDANERITP